MTALQRVHAALGRRLDELLVERPRRRAWTELPADELERAFREAQRQARDGQAGRSFATLLIGHLDHLVGLESEPPPDVERIPGDTVDSFGRLHRPDHGAAARARARRSLERVAEDVYASTYEQALDAGLGETEAHGRAASARIAVLRSETG